VPGFALQVLQFFCGLFRHAAANHTSSRASGSHPLELCRPCAASPVDCLSDAVLSSPFPVPALLALIQQLGRGLVDILELLRGPLELSFIPPPLPVSLATFEFFVLSPLERPLYLSDLDLELFARRPKGFASSSTLHSLLPCVL
jgi:hypothetical protein